MKQNQNRHQIRPILKRDGFIYNLLFSHSAIKFTFLLFILLFVIIADHFLQANFAIPVAAILFMTLFFFVVQVIHSVRNAYERLMKSNQISNLIGSYFLLVFGVIFLLSVCFNLVSAVHLGDLQYTKSALPATVRNTPGVSIPLEDFYFTAVTFFTIGYGDVVPTGLCKLLAVFTAFVGQAINVVVMAVVLNFYLQKKKK